VCKLASPAPNVEDALAVDRLHEIHHGRTVLSDKAVLALVGIDVSLDHNIDKHSKKCSETRVRTGWTMDPNTIKEQGHLIEN
jgi:hypothetical protein